MGSELGLGLKARLGSGLESGLGLGVGLGLGFGSLLQPVEDRKAGEAVDLPEI